MDLADWQMWWKRDGRYGLGALLLREWNPIDVDVPEDEYLGFAGKVAQCSGKAVPTASLRNTSDRLGPRKWACLPRPDDDLRVAASGARWYQKAIRRPS
jgi:hypothetical protein